MPERRNLTAFSPGLYETSRKKPKDRESPSELDKRLGFKESLTAKRGKAVDPGKEVPEGTPMDRDFTTPACFFQMSSCQMEEGRLARFHCRVVGVPTPEITWMKDDKVIESEGRFKLLNFNSEIFSLLVKDVQLEDSGRYTCSATNIFGSASTESRLTVLSPLAEDEQDGDMPPRFLTKFYDQQTTEGLEAEFKCLIGGRPAPGVTWLLDDIELQDAPEVRLRRKDGVASLEVKSPTMDQSGQYTCHISNELGEATCSAHLTVIENKLRGKMLPKFLKRFDHVTVREGEEAIFTAVVVGEPKATVSWKYNDKPLDASRRYVMNEDGDTYTLTVKNARFEDSGKISCKAVNEEGQVYCYGNLLVRESR